MAVGFGFPHSGEFRTRLERPSSDSADTRVGNQSRSKIEQVRFQ